MGDQTLILREAWAVYDCWLEDTRVEFLPDPRNIDNEFRQVTEPFATKQATKWVGDCWLLAFAKASGARLVTFDKALYAQARKIGNRAILPA